MNIGDIAERIRQMVQREGDNERQHDIEDCLYSAFIAAVADGTYEGDIAEGARLVLTTQDIDFVRWYA